MEVEWTTVIKPKRVPKEERRTYISDETAQKLERTLHVAFLKDALLSEESRRFQREGWCFDRVLKPDDPFFGELCEGSAVRLLDVNNKYGDVVVFTKDV